MFAIGLGLQGVLPKVRQSDVVLKLSAYVDDLDATIHDVRKTIFSLQEPEDRPSGLRGEIVRAVTTAAGTLQFEPLLTMGGPLDSAVPDGLRPDLIAVIGEALTNVARHSGGQVAEVRVSVDTEGRTVTAVIEDDGKGPAAQRRSRARHGEHGLPGAAPGRVRSRWSAGAAGRRPADLVGSARSHRPQNKNSKKTPWTWPGGSSASPPSTTSSSCR